jgi:hypothetical protein
VRRFGHAEHDIIGVHHGITSVHIRQAGSNNIAVNLAEALTTGEMSCFFVVWSVR